MGKRGVISAYRQETEGVVAPLLLHLQLPTGEVPERERERQRTWSLPARQIPENLPAGPCTTWRPRVISLAGSCEVRAYPNKIAVGDQKSVMSVIVPSDVDTLFCSLGSGFLVPERIGNRRVVLSLSASRAQQHSTWLDSAVGMGRNILCSVWRFRASKEPEKRFRGVLLLV